MKKCISLFRFYVKLAELRLILLLLFSCNIDHRPITKWPDIDRNLAHNDPANWSSSGNTQRIRYPDSKFKSQSVFNQAKVALRMIEKERLRDAQNSLLRRCILVASCNIGIHMSGLGVSMLVFQRLSVDIKAG